MQLHACAYQGAAPFCACWSPRGVWQRRHTRVRTDARCRSTAQVAEGFDNDSFESSTVSNRAEVRVSWALKDALRMTVQFVGSLT